MAASTHSIMTLCGQNCILALMIQAVFGILLFLYGFFPLKIPDGHVATMDDVPSSIGDIQFPNNEFYKPVLGRLVIMVIDALRWDFVADPSGSINMPYVSSIIKHSKACLLKGKANPPTVTMPRIKALTTGTIPNFIDVILNLGSQEIKEDSLIRQAVGRGLKVVFYGDDTWTKLFPHSFIRSEGTSSFFVTDYTEVDDNVTRHLDSELSAADWDIMVLHYLGLDHIGHLEGPKSPKVGPKLQEMDKVAKEIHTRLLHWSKSTNQTAAVVICGDHGMKDSGSHGGASLAEVLVPVLTLGLSCPENRATESVGQIDMVPTFSVLLGLPIPSGNLGKLVPSLLRGLPVSRQLHALYYNVQQLAGQFRRHVSSHNSHRGWIAYEEAVTLHCEWLTSGGSLDAAARRVHSLYSVALDEMSCALANSLVEFDVYVLVVASIILVQVCLLLFLASPWPSLGGRECLLFMLLLLWNVVFCSASQCRSLLCETSTLHGVVATGLVCILLSWDFSWLLWHTQFRVKLPRTTVPGFLAAGMLLHVCSFASSSFIEEEHQVWYFFWATFILLASQHVRFSATLAVLAAHRVLRKLNQTGDKWASLPDLNNWLSMAGHEKYLITVFLAGLYGVLCCCCFLMPSKVKRLLSFIAVSSVFSYRAAVGNISIPDHPQSRGLQEVQVFWSILLVLAFVGAAQCRHLGTELPGTLAGCWVLLAALLHRPHNVVLIPAQVLFSAHLHHALQWEATHWNVLAHVWLGMLFYFYQGNSNSFASIDVAAGYVGLQDYHPYVVGTLLVCHTYSSPVLSHLLLLSGLARRRQWDTDFVSEGQQLEEVCRAVAIARLLPLAVYVALAAWQRYHLFVWTVFSPKLLYEAMHTAVTSALLILTISSYQVYRYWKAKQKFSLE